MTISEKAIVDKSAKIHKSAKICDYVVIGAGAVVTKDISQPGVYVGNPAVKIKDLKLNG